MYCELLNKDVQIELWKEYLKQNDQPAYKCSECYVEIKGSGGRKMFVYCDKMSDSKCLIKQHLDIK